MAVSEAYLAYLIRSNVQPFVRAHGQWVNEQIVPIVNDFERRAKAVQKISDPRAPHTSAERCANWSALWMSPARIVTVCLPLDRAG
jgi:hypothetical protein